MKNIYVGNIPEDITKQDICEIFGLNSTSYLRDTCNVDFPINNQTEKLKGFAFIRASEHITDELIKLDDIVHHDNEFRVEDAILKDHSKVRSLRKGGGVIEKRTKRNRGTVVLACVYIRFFKQKC